MEPILEPIRKGSKPSPAPKLPKRAPKTGTHWDPARSRFVADWVDSSGKRHRPRFKTREEAEARLAEIRAIQNDQDRVGASLTAAERWDAGFGLGLWKAAGREYEPGFFTNLIREKLGSASARKITFATAAESRLKDLAVTAKGGEGGRTYRSAKNRLGAFAGLGKMLLSEIRREDIEKILDKLGAKPGG